MSRGRSLAQPRGNAVRADVSCLSVQVRVNVPDGRISNGCRNRTRYIAAMRRSDALEHKTGLCLPQPSSWIVSLGAWIGLALGACVSGSYAAENGCDRVLFDSIDGVVWIRHASIESLATPHEGIADFVEVKVPTPPVGPNKIRSLVLWADLHPFSHAACQSGPDFEDKPAVNCSESVPGTPLQLIAAFEPGSKVGLEAQTDALTSYVLRHVLNCHVGYF